MSKYEIRSIGHTQFGLDSFTIIEEADNETEAVFSSEEEITKRIEIGFWESGYVDVVTEL